MRWSAGNPGTGSSSSASSATPTGNSTWPSAPTTPRTESRVRGACATASEAGGARTSSSAKNARSSSGRAERSSWAASPTAPGPCRTSCTEGEVPEPSQTTSEAMVRGRASGSRRGWGPEVSDNPWPAVVPAGSAPRGAPQVAEEETSAATKDHPQHEAEDEQEGPQACGEQKQV